MCGVCMQCVAAFGIPCMLYQQEKAVIVVKFGGSVFRHVPCPLYVGAALPSAQG